MKITCTSENLKTAVLAVERFTGRHVTLPILSHILCRADEKNITLIATNLEIGIEYYLNGKVHKPGLVTLPAKALSQILSSSEDETVTIESKQHQVSLHTSSTDATLLGLGASDFPNLPTIKPEHTLTLPTADLVAALGRVIPAAATSDLKPELSGVLIAANGKTLSFAATDSFRLAEYTLTGVEGIGERFECIVPLRTAQEIVRTLSAADAGEVRMTVGEHQVVFAAGPARILSRLVDGAYPPYQTIIPKSYETALSVSRGDLQKRIRLAAVFSSRLNDVTFRFSPTELEVSTANAETGSTTTRLPAKGRGASGSAAFNFRYLADGLEAAGGEQVLLNLNGVSGPAMIQNPADASFFYLVMPIRSV